MRSALILATFALTILAAPVPKAEGQAPVRRQLTDNDAPIETLMDKRYRRPITSRSIEIEVEKRSGRSPTQRRSEEEDDEVDVEKRSGRSPTQRRSEEENEVEVEKRSGRSATQRRSEGENEVELEKRSGRSPTQRRSEEENEVEVEKRSGRSPTQRRSEEEDEVEVEKRSGRSPTQRRSEEVKNTIRSIYDGVAELVEALKTRGFSSADSLPARQTM